MQQPAAWQCIPGRGDVTKHKGSGMAARVLESAAHHALTAARGSRDVLVLTPDRAAAGLVRRTLELHAPLNSSCAATCSTVEDWAVGAIARLRPHVPLLRGSIIRNAAFDELSIEDFLSRRRPEGDGPAGQRSLARPLQRLIQRSARASLGPHEFRSLVGGTGAQGEEGTPLPVAFSHAVALAFHRGEQGTVPWYDAPRVVRSRVADCLDAGPLYRQLLPGPCSVVVVDPDGYHPAECALLGEVMRHAPPEVEFAVFSPEGGGGDSPAPASRSWELHAVAADRAGHSSLGSAGGAAFLQEALDRRAGGVGAGAGDVWTRVDVRSGLVSGRGVVLDTEADEVDWIAQHVCRLLDEGAHPHDVAVLTPRFGDASRVADALSQRHGVGTESADDFATPLKTPHGRAVLDLLRLACDPHDPRVVASLATSPVVGLHPSLLARVALQPRHRATSLASIVHAMGDPASRVPRPARCDEATWQAFRARCGAFSGLLSLAESLSDGTRSAADAAAALLRASGLQDDTTGAMSRALWAVQAAGEAAGSDSVGAVLPYASALASLPRGDALLAEGPGPSRVLAVDGEMRPRAGLSAVHVGTLHGAQHAAFRHVVLARARTTSLPGPRPAAQLWLPGEDATATAHRRHETAALSRVLGGADGSVVATVARKYPSLAREQALAQVLGPLLAGGVHHRPGPVIQARDNDCSDSSTLNASSKAQRSGGGPLVSTPAAAEGGGVAAEAAAGNEQLRLSVSRVNEYRRCPRAYFFARVLRLPTEPNPLLTYGSHVHGGVELFWWLAARSVLADAGPLSEAEALERVLARTRAAWEAPDTLRAFGDPASTDKALGRAEQVLRAFVARQYRSDVAPDQGAGLFTWLTAAQGADSGRKRIALPEQPFTVPMDRVDAHLNGVWDLLLIDAPVDGSAATQAMESELLDIAEQEIARLEGGGGHTGTSASAAPEVDGGEEEEEAIVDVWEDALLQRRVGWLERHASLFQGARAVVMEYKSNPMGSIRKGVAPWAKRYSLQAHAYEAALRTLAPAQDVRTWVSNIETGAGYSFREAEAAAVLAGRSAEPEQLHPEAAPEPYLRKLPAKHANEIVSVVRGVRGTDYEPTPSYSACAFCAFSANCDASVAPR